MSGFGDMGAESGLHYLGRDRQVVGRPRESAGARLGFDGAVRGRLQENEVGEMNTAAWKEAQEPEPKMYWGEAHREYGYAR